MENLPRVPSLSLLERLYTRNEYLINSHHPLRETLIQQTGQDEANRRDFLQTNYKKATEVLIHNWDLEPSGPAEF